MFFFFFNFGYIYSISCVQALFNHDFYLIDYIIIFFITGVGRTPPGASNGVGRGGPSTRGRSTGTTSYQVRI